MMDARGISRLRLQQFRNFKALDCSLDSRVPTIIYGPNGSGKTSILEALSIFGGGRGLRGGHFAEMVHHPNSPTHNPSLWSAPGDEKAQKYIRANATSSLPYLEQSDFVVDILYGEEQFHLHYQHAKGMSIVHDGKSLTSRKGLRTVIPTLWLTPQYCFQFLTTNQIRLRTLDKMASVSQPKHANHVNRLQRHVRARTLLLQQPRLDRAHLDIIEAVMALDISIISSNRLMLVEKLSHFMSRKEHDFARVEIRLDGLACELLKKHDAQTAEQHIREHLRQMRAQEGESTIPQAFHHPRVILMYAERDTGSSDLSTGEQQAMIFSFLHASIRLMLDDHVRTPLVLLDDVFAHLDEKKRTTIQRALLEQPICLWCTGVERELFKGIAGNSQSLALQSMTSK